MTSVYYKQRFSYPEFANHKVQGADLRIEQFGLMAKQDWQGSFTKGSLPEKYLGILI